MKKTFKSFFISLIFCSFFCNVLQAGAQTITEKINRNGNVSIFHSEKIEQRLLPRSEQVDSIGLPATEESAKPKQMKVKGYRVLVFTDNNLATARNEANDVAKSIANVFPEYPVYVGYSTPNWRVKIGDFTTKDEALALLTEIKNKLPKLAAEARVIHESVNIQ